MQLRLRRSAPSNSQPAATAERVDQVKHLEERAARRQGLITNLPAYAGAAIIVLVIAKVALVSRGSSSTMLALIADASPLQILSGAVVALLPFCGLIVIHANESRYKYRPGLSKGRLGEIQSILFLAVFLLSFLLSAVWLVTTVLILLIRHLVFIRDKKRGRAVERSAPLPHEEWLRRPPQDSVCYGIWQSLNQMEAEKKRLLNQHPVDLARLSQLDEEMRALAARFNERADRINKLTFSEGAIFAPVVSVYLVGLLIQFFGNDKPWMPAERIALDGKQVQVGYVVNSGDSWTTVLTEDSRIILRIPSGDIKSRTVCGMSKEDSGRTKTIYRYFSKDVPAYKPCPKIPGSRTR